MSLNLFVLEEESLKQKAAERREGEDSRDKDEGRIFRTTSRQLDRTVLYDTDDIDSGTDYMYGILQMVLWIIDLSTTTTRSITSDELIKLT